MSASPFSDPKVQLAMAKRNHGPLGRTPALRDGPRPERFYKIMRFYNIAQGRNDGYELYNGDRWSVFAGQQPLIEAAISTPLPTGQSQNAVDFKFYVHWGHDKEGRKVVTEVQPVPIPPAPASAEEMAELRILDIQKHSNGDKPMAKQPAPAPVGGPNGDSDKLDDWFQRPDTVQHDAEGAVVANVVADSNADGEGIMTDEQILAFFDKKAAEKPALSLGDASAQPPDDTPHYADDPKAAVYAIPNHIKKELALEEANVGLHIRNVYGGPIADYIAKNGPMKAYLAANDYVVKVKSEKPANGSKPQEAAQAAPTQPTATSLPETQPALTGDNFLSVEKANQMNEAAFVVLVNLYAPFGAELRFTIRAMTADELATRLDALVSTFTKRGYTLQRAIQPAPAAQPAQPQMQPQPTPQAAANAGIATCVMISVGSSFEGGKPQLQFECDGYEHPLRYTKASAGMLAQMLAGIKKMDGLPFAAADLEPGRKFPGMWFVDWKESTNGEGKTYRNVMSVRPAQAATVAA